jgi:hypothetical protein
MTSEKHLLFYLNFCLANCFERKQPAGNTPAGCFISAQFTQILGFFSIAGLAAPSKTGEIVEKKRGCGVT